MLLAWDKSLELVHWLFEQIVSQAMASNFNAKMLFGQEAKNYAQKIHETNCSDGNSNNNSWIIVNATRSQ